MMHNFDKNEESKQLKPWPSSLICSLGFLPPYSVCVYSCPFKNTLNKIRFMPEAVQVNIQEDILLSCENQKTRKKTSISGHKTRICSRPFSTHRENKPFEVGVEPRRRRARGKTSSGNKTSLPGAVAVLKTPGAKSPY